MNPAEAITDWLVQETSAGPGRVSLLLQVAGPTALAAYLQQSLPQVPMTGIQPPNQPPFDWSLAAVLAEPEVAVVRAVLRGLTGRYLLAAGDAGPLEALIALEPHGRYEGAFHFSPGGLAIVGTKRESTPAAWAQALSYWYPRLAAFIDSQPRVRSVDAISWIPSGEQSARRAGAGAVPTLVEQLARRLADQYRWRQLPLGLRVERAQKRLSEPLARLLNEVAAFTVSATEPAGVGGGRVLLLDDVVASGVSLRQAGRLLRQQGAAGVVGVALTRAYPHRPAAGADSPSPA